MFYAFERHISTFEHLQKNSSVCVCVVNESEHFLGNEKEHLQNV